MVAIIFGVKQGVAVAMLHDPRTTTNLPFYAMWCLIIAIVENALFLQIQARS